MSIELISRFTDLLHAATNPRAEAMLIHGYDVTRDDFALRYCCEDKMVGGRAPMSDIRLACEEQDSRLVREWAAVWAATEAEPGALERTKQKWEEAASAGILMHEHRAAS